MSSVTTTLRKLQQSLQACDVSCLDENGLRAATSEIRSAERVLAAVKVRIGQRANELSLTGTGADAGAKLLGVGDVSAGTARAEAARADLASAMPALADALADGRVAAEHLDAVARV